MKTAQTLFLLSAFLLLSTSQAAFAEHTGFPDVPDTEIYASGIAYLESQNIVDGYPDDKYRPKNMINRAEMLKIVVEGYAEFHDFDTDFLDDYRNDKCFDDVPRNEWYTKYVCWANG